MDLDWAQVVVVGQVVVKHVKVRVIFVLYVTLIATPQFLRQASVTGWPTWHTFTSYDTEQSLPSETLRRRYGNEEPGR